MVTRKNGNKSVEDQVIDQTIVQTIDPMVSMMTTKINQLDPSLSIDNNSSIDQLLELLAIATNNKKQRDQLIDDISKLTTNKKVLESLDIMTIDKLQETLDNLKDPVMIKVKLSVNKDDINYTDYQSSKVMDVMLYIQGQKTSDQLLEDPIDCAIGSVFIKTGNSKIKPQYFCEVFKTTVVLADNAYELGLTAKQVKLLSNEIAGLWCYETKSKRIKTKQANDKKKQNERDLMRENMIKAVRDRGK